MKTFSIETLKWVWHKNVRQPDIYRDHQVIRTKTKEEALESVHFLLKQPKGNTYTITVLQNDEYVTYFMYSMPCLGGLVKYRDHSGEAFYMNPYLPRDIKVAFPEGEVIYIGICIKNIKKDLESPYYQFLLSEESPWIAAFGNKDTIIFEQDYFILTNMRADPTVFYSLMRLGGLGNGGIYNTYQLKKDIHPKAQILLTKAGMPYADPRRLAGQLPIRTSGGPWKDGWGYTRVWNESIFKTKLPKQLKDFGSCPSGGHAPNFPFTNECFAKEMKDKFGVDITKPDEKMYEACVGAWDYFKDAAKELKD